jgi:hypothetical protein
MKKDNKDNKSMGPKSVVKGATLAAMVAALGISLGTEVKNVYAQGNEFKEGSNILMAGTLQDKHTQVGGSQEAKVEYTGSISGKIVSISGNRVNFLDSNNKAYEFYVHLRSGGDASSYLGSHYHVGGTISGKIENGQLVIEDVSSR